MRSIDRRGFMKTLCATAASAVCSDSSQALSSVVAETQPELRAAVLENGEQQLRFSSQHTPLSFQNFLRIGNEWKPATLPGISLVSGPSFPLVTSSVIKQPRAVLCKGTASAQGLDGRTLEYAWNAEISAENADGKAPWFRFRTTLHLPGPVRLHHAEQVEPQIIVWLNSISMLMEGQAGSWRRVLLQQPTRNSLGAWGNDLPALYMLDQNAGVETMMYFEISDMAWMSMENLPRFLVYRCSNVSHIERDGTQKLGVGLIAEQATGDVLPAGDVRFSYWFLQRPVTTLLNEQQAVTRWMQALLPLFEEKLSWPACAASWKHFAAGTVEDLQDKNTAQVEINGHTGLRAYIKGSSQLWKQPADNFELMTVADVLWPSLLYVRLHANPTFEQECKQLVADLPGFFRAESHSISNSYRTQENERADSWYPFENGLIKYPMIGSLAGSEEIRSRFLDAFQTARKMAHQYDYLFPIYYRVDSLAAEGAGTNYAVGGLYAWAACLAFRFTGEQQHRDEAQQAVRTLCTVPSERLFHEPQELGYGALAAAELGLRDEASYLLYQQLRMFYWYSDPSQKSHDIRGMVQAAASILYPAFKENVEAILPWTGIMKRGIVLEGMLRFMDQQRRNNFSFFEECTVQRISGKARFIPFENLGTLELGGQTGNVGKEIYGAGECLWMYLMFEALGQITDRELMLVNLDLLDVFDAATFPARQLHFILYNPTPEPRTATVTIPPAKGGKVRLSANGKALGEAPQIPPRGMVLLLAEF
jgi:hypothetical protein